MQYGPPYDEQSVGPTNELPSTSALPPVSVIAAQFCGCDPSPKVTLRIRIGVMPAQLSKLNEPQNVWPGRQNWPGWSPKRSEWPISQTNAIGVSSTAPQSSALPICCVSNAGVSGPSPGLLSTSTLDVWPLVSSVTCSW